MKDKGWIWFLARVFIGLVFAYAGYTKLLDPVENFRGGIAQYEVIPYAWVPFIAYTLPWVEFIFGILMILGYAPKLASVVLGGLCLGFTLILGSSDLFLSGASQDCGCFGEGSLIRLTMHQVFFIDFCNFVFCIRLFYLKDHWLSLDSVLRQKS